MKPCGRTLLTSHSAGRRLAFASSPTARRRHAAEGRHVPRRRAGGREIHIADHTLVEVDVSTGYDMNECGVRGLQRHAVRRVDAGIMRRRAPAVKPSVRRRRW
jgi:hypothetical protein